MKLSSVRSVLCKTTIVSFNRCVFIGVKLLIQVDFKRFHSSLQAEQETRMKTCNDQFATDCGSSANIGTNLSANDCSALIGRCCGDMSTTGSSNSFTDQQLIVDKIISSQSLSQTNNMMDTHCHLQLEPLYAHFHQCIDNALKCGVTHLSVCGTCPGQDWSRVEEIYRAYPQMVSPSFGLHPWRIKQHLLSGAELTDTNVTHDNTFVRWEWEAHLERLLLAIPSAGVGECGLDKGLLKKGDGQSVDWVTQERILHAHLRLASRYCRPITLHCVGAWGRLLDVLTEHFTSSAWSKSTPRPVVILHSCNSLPADMVSRFIKLLGEGEGVYFSLSGGGSEVKTAALIRVIPLTQLLVETDSPDQLPTALRSLGLTHNQPCLVRANCRHLAERLVSEGVVETEEQLEATVTENARRAFGMVTAW